MVSREFMLGLAKKKGGTPVGIPPFERKEN
jgi:hypothetical protein